MMSDDIQVIDYSSSPAGSRSSPALGRMTNKSPATHSKPSTPSPAVIQQLPQQVDPMLTHAQSKYAALLAIIEELGKDIRPTYAGNKLAAERLKRGIVHARVLTRDCMQEADRNIRGSH
ncbi:hypothetical protein EB796_016925 [Bugula neritina]|uniref:Cyclin-dependent kinase 2-associated protein 1 n=1 Tax=Bugula neritina TaxID=10212 RepID=A0A7J7JF59_BUGNE|nr:hypothetical protein EB796_016925 [Bugula neritina]